MSVINSMIQKPENNLCEDEKSMALFHVDHHNTSEPTYSFLKRYYGRAYLWLWMSVIRPQ